MSDQWEKYVEPAAVSIDPAAFDKSMPNHDGMVRQFRRDRATELAQGVLAVVGPLIAEDTRERLVAAAARAVERELASAENPFESLRKTLAFSANDWGSAGDFAWLYGIVFGWSDDEGGDHLEDLAAKFDWTPDAVARLRKLHTSFEAAAQAWECAS